MGPGGTAVSQRHKALPKIQTSSNWEKMLGNETSSFLLSNQGLLYALLLYKLQQGAELHPDTSHHQHLSHGPCIINVWWINESSLIDTTASLYRSSDYEKLKLAV